MISGNICAEYTSKIRNTYEMKKAIRSSSSWPNDGSKHL